MLWLIYVKVLGAESVDDCVSDRLGPTPLLARSWILSLLECARSAAGALVLAVALGLVTAAVSQDAQAVTRTSDAHAGATAFQGLDRSIMRNGSRSAASMITKGEHGCPDDQHHASCAFCVGPCAGCSAVIAFATSDLGLETETCAPAVGDRLGLALTKLDIAFRPPRSLL